MASEYSLHFNLVIAQLKVNVVVSNSLYPPQTGRKTRAFPLQHCQSSVETQTFLLLLAHFPTLHATGDSALIASQAQT